MEYVFEINHLKTELDVYVCIFKCYTILVFDNIL